jgi:hypothetical protein
MFMKLNNIKIPFIWSLIILGIITVTIALWVGKSASEAFIPTETINAL